MSPRPAGVARRPIPLDRLTRSFRRDLAASTRRFQAAVQHSIEHSGIFDRLAADAARRETAGIKALDDVDIPDWEDAGEAIGRNYMSLGDSRAVIIERLFGIEGMELFANIITDDARGWEIELGNLAARWYPDLYGYGAKGAMLKLGVRPSFELRNPLILDSLADRANLLSGSVARSAFQRIKTIVAEDFYVQGKHPFDVAQHLTEEFDWLSRQRAENIARTETLAVTSNGQWTLYKASGIERRRWLTTLDGKERYLHWKLHGQIRPIDEPFTIEDDEDEGLIHELMYPGDEQAAAKMVCNCRCDEIPLVYAGQEVSTADVWRGDVDPDEFSKERLAARRRKRLKAYMPEFILSLWHAMKHGDHDQSTHGNWARGGAQAEVESTSTTNRTFKLPTRVNSKLDKKVKALNDLVARHFERVNPKDFNVWTDHVNTIQAQLRHAITGAQYEDVRDAIRRLGLLDRVADWEEMSGSREDRAALAREIVDKLNTLPDDEATKEWKELTGTPQSIEITYQKAPNPYTIYTREEAEQALKDAAKDLREVKKAVKNLRESMPELAGIKLDLVMGSGQVSGRVLALAGALNGGKLNASHEPDLSALPEGVTLAGIAKPIQDLASEIRKLNFLHELAMQPKSTLATLGAHNFNITLSDKEKRAGGRLYGFVNYDKQRQLWLYTGDGRIGGRNGGELTDVFKRTMSHELGHVNYLGVLMRATADDEDGKAANTVLNAFNKAASDNRMIPVTDYARTYAEKMFGPPPEARRPGGTNTVKYETYFNETLAELSRVDRQGPPSEFRQRLLDEMRAVKGYNTIHEELVTLADGTQIPRVEQAADEYLAAYKALRVALYAAPKHSYTGELIVGGRTIPGAKPRAVRKPRKPKEPPAPTAEKQATLVKLLRAVLEDEKGLKHEAGPEHDQASHGNWARGISAGEDDKYRFPVDESIRKQFGSAIQTLSKMEPPKDPHLRAAFSRVLNDMRKAKLKADEGDGAWAQSLAANSLLTLNQPDLYAVMSPEARKGVLSAYQALVESNIAARAQQEAGFETEKPEPKPEAEPKPRKPHEGNRQKATRHKTDKFAAEARARYLDVTNRMELGMRLWAEVGNKIPPGLVVPARGYGDPGTVVRGVPIGTTVAELVKAGQVDAAGATMEHGTFYIDHPELYAHVIAARDRLMQLQLVEAGYPPERSHGAGKPREDLPEPQRAKLEELEEKYRGRFIERGNIVDENGVVVAGGYDHTVEAHTSWNLTPSEKQKMYNLPGSQRQKLFLTHNHPWSYSLSHGDILFARQFGLAGVRAVTPDGGVHSLRFGKDYDVPYSKVEEALKKADDEISFKHSQMPQAVQTVIRMRLLVDLIEAQTPQGGGFRYDYIPPKPPKPKPARKPRRRAAEAA